MALTCIGYEKRFMELIKGKRRKEPKYTIRYYFITVGYDGNPLEGISCANFDSTKGVFNYLTKVLGIKEPDALDIMSEALK